MDFGYYLMIKEAKEIGLKYLCKCADYKDPEKYKGSGVYWKKRTGSGKYEITTTILGHYDNQEDLRTAGEMFSEKFDIVKDSSWANLIPEIGDGGATVRKKIRAYNTADTSQQRFFNSEEELPQGWVRGLPHYPRPKAATEKVRQFHLGRKRSNETKQKMKNAKRSPRARVACPNCSRMLTKQNLNRHLVNCSS